MNKSIVLLLLSFTISPAFADSGDFRLLNHQGIEAMRAGDLKRSEELFKAALSAYKPEPSRFNESICNNLALLETKLKQQSSHALVGSISSCQTLEEFIQPLLDNAASAKMHTATHVPLRLATISTDGFGAHKIKYSVLIHDGYSLELEAYVKAEGIGKYKLMSLRSELFYPVALNSPAFKLKASDFNLNTGTEAIPYAASAQAQKDLESPRKAGVEKEQATTKKAKLDQEPEPATKAEVEQEPEPAKKAEVEKETEPAPAATENNEGSAASNQGPSPAEIAAAAAAARVAWIRAGAPMPQM